MKEVELEGFEAVSLDGGDEVGQLVEGCFCFPPVVRVFPVCSQSLDVGKGRARVPACALELVVGKPGEGEAGLEVVELGVGDGEVNGLMSAIVSCLRVSMRGIVC